MLPLCFFLIHIRICKQNQVILEPFSDFLCDSREFLPHYKAVNDKKVIKFFYADTIRLNKLLKFIIWSCIILGPGNGVSYCNTRRSLFQRGRETGRLWSYLKLL